MSILMVATIGWSRLMAAMAQLRFPPSFVIILDMTYRYIHLLLDTVANMFMARKSRMVSRPSKREIREIGGSSVTNLFNKSYKMSENVYQAMISRGYTGKPRVMSDLQGEPHRRRVHARRHGLRRDGAVIRPERFFDGIAQSVPVPWGLELMTTPIISLKNVTYRYPDGNTAIDGLDLDIEPGEAVAIVGPNGAGKSTLLQIIAGLIPVSEGRLTVTGKEIDRKSVDRPNDLEWLRRKLGIIFQDSDVRFIQFDRLERRRFRTSAHGVAGGRDKGTRQQGIGHGWAYPISGTAPLID